MSQSISFDIIAKDRASATFSKISKSSERSHRGLAKFGKLAAVGIGGVTAALGVAGTMGLKTAAGLQQAQIGFESMLGSGKKANRFLGDLKKFAAKTPFEMPGLIENSRMLLGVGVEAKKVLPLLQDFGDAAGALGIKQDAFSRAMLAMSQSISAGKIKLGDMNQLMNAGLPIWQLLSEAVGKPVPEIQKMISKGELLTKDVLPKLQKVMHKNYGGAMEKQSKTLNGLWSTFMDTLNIGLADSLMPLVPVLQKVMPGAIKVMGDALAKVPGFIEKIGDIAGPIVKRIRDVAPKVATALGSWRDAFTHALDGVKVTVGPVIDSIKTALDSGDWGPVGKSLGGALIKALEGAGSMAGDLLNTLDKMFGKIDWVGLGITIGKQAPALLIGLAAGIINFDFDGLLKGLGKHWQTILIGVITVALLPAKIIGIIGKLLARIPFVGKFLQWALLGFKKLSDGMVGMVGRFLGFIGKAAIEGFRRVFPTVGNAFAEALQLLPTRLGVVALDLQAKALSMMRGLGGAIARGTGAVVAKVVELIAKLLKPWARAGGWLVGKGAALIRGLARGISSALGPVVGAARTVVTKIVGVYASAGRWLISKGVDLMRGLGSGVRTGITTVLGVMRGIGGRLLRALGSLGSLLYNAGKDLIQGLINGIMSKLSALASAMGKVASKVKSFLPGSPVKEGPLRSWNNGGAGKRLVDLLATGLNETRPVDQAMKRLAARLSTTSSLSTAATAATRSPARGGSARPAGQSAQMMSGSGGGGAGGTVVNITINGALDPIAVGKQVEDALNKVKRSRGNRSLAFL